MRDTDASLLRLSYLDRLQILVEEGKQRWWRSLTRSADLAFRLAHFTLLRLFAQASRQPVVFMQKSFFMWTESPKSSGMHCGIACCLGSSFSQLNRAVIANCRLQSATSTPDHFQNNFEA
jgi:hypothetical protein